MSRHDANRLIYNEVTIFDRRHCLQNAALTEPPCRRVYIATSCATGMRIGVSQ